MLVRRLRQKDEEEEGEGGDRGDDEEDQRLDEDQRRHDHEEETSCFFEPTRVTRILPLKISQKIHLTLSQKPQTF